MEVQSEGNRKDRKKPKYKKPPEASDFPVSVFSRPAVRILSTVFSNMCNNHFTGNINREEGEQKKSSIKQATIQISDFKGSFHPYYKTKRIQIISSHTDLCLTGFVSVISASTFLQCWWMELHFLTLFRQTKHDITFNSIVSLEADWLSLHQDDLSTQIIELLF